MTKKKNLKFKVGDRVRVVTEPTCGPKKNPIKTGGGVQVGEVYYVAWDYGDGDYNLGTKNTNKFVHQRHLVLDDTAVDKALPGPLTWSQVAVGDKVTATSTVRLLGSSTNSKVTHTDIAHFSGPGGYVYHSDLYWKDLNLTVHRNYDSWTITEIVKAKDLPKPEPRTLIERRQWRKVKVLRTVPDDGLWVGHVRATGHKYGVVESLIGYTGAETGVYWARFQDGSRVKLTEGRDQVFVNGYLKEFKAAQDATHLDT